MTASQDRRSVRPLSWDTVRRLEAEPDLLPVALIARRYMEAHDRRQNRWYRRAWRRVTEA